MINDAQIDEVSPVESGVWGWADLPIERHDAGERRAMFDGSLVGTRRVIGHASTVKAGQRPHPPHRHDGIDELLVIKAGTLRVTVGDETAELGADGVALAVGGEDHGWVNVGDDSATYVVLRFESGKRAVVDDARRESAQRFWDLRNVPFQSNSRGGFRAYFERATPTQSRIELHETTLRSGELNHPPHQHEAAGMILLREGEAAMEIAGRRFEGKAGDLFLVAPGDLHCLVTQGSGPCRYLALHWQ